MTTSDMGVHAEAINQQLLLDCSDLTGAPRSLTCLPLWPVPSPAVGSGKVSALVGLGQLSDTCPGRGEGNEIKYMFNTESISRGQQ